MDPLPASHEEIESKSKWKLKDPKVLRIFFSSPFNGMEGEREELTKKYFPQFHHACNSHGMQFVGVDMRWGITTESADNAQVVNICLRELDRSDVFIGFFGQRYGWFGETDELLQKNIDNAAGRYQWLNDVKDRSITELEFLHGHLNHPGKLPACICFRDKAFDDAHKEKAIAEGNKRNIAKFSAESEHSSQMMNNLIERVKATESNMLGLNVNYKNPLEGAKFMFDSVYETCLRLIAEANAIHLSPLEQDRVCHNAFISSLTNIYFGVDDYWDKIHFDNFESGCGYLVHGPQGSGKSSLLAKLAMKLQESDSGIQVVYHFIGSGPGTTSPENILNRIVDELENISNAPITITEEGGGSAINSSDIGKKTVNTHDLFVKLQSEMERIVSLGLKLVLILDGLNKVQASSKTAKHLYWLPSKLPIGVKLIVSTTSTDSSTFDLLVTERKFVNVEIQPLSLEVQASISKELLMRSGKELSPYQLQKVVDAEQTKNPRFLKTVLSEISIFGSFRLLDSKIDSLVKCDGIKDLLQEVLQRMEEDYNVNDHPILMVNEVLSAIAVTHQGLSENEIQEIFAISSHNWSPFYFALENFLISHGGLLRFSFLEMQNAVEDRYLQSQDDKLSAMQNLVDYFNNTLQTYPFNGDLDALVYKRVAGELPWIINKMGDKKALGETIADPKLFCHLQSKSNAELIDFYAETGLSGNELCAILLRQFDVAINDIHGLQTEQTEESLEPPGYKLTPVLIAAKSFFDELRQHEASIKIIKRNIRILEGIGGKINEQVRKIELRDCYYHLATAYVNDTQFDMALPIFDSIKTECEEILLTSDNPSIRQTLGYVCNGIGVMYSFQQRYEEAQALFERSLEFHKGIGNKSLVADCETNIGMCLMNSGKLKEALESYNSALQVFEKENFGHLPLTVGNLLTNIALCHRRENNLDLAEEMYKRSLKVKINAVGPQHEVVASAYMNLGVLEMYRKDAVKAEEYTRQAKEIMEALEVKLEQHDMWQVLENYMSALNALNRKPEALPIFMRVFPMLKREGKVSWGHTGLHNEMMQYMLECDMYKEVSDFVQAYISSPSLRVPSHFKVLLHCDLQLPPDERPVRPREQTVAYALSEIWPGNNELTAYYVVNQVLPANDVDLLLSLLDTMDVKNPDFVETTYEVGALWCDNAKNYEAMLKVAEAGLLKYPQARSLQSRMFDALRQLHRYQEAYQYVHVVLEKEENNQALILVCGHVAMYANDIELCQELWKKAASMEDENLAEKAKSGLKALEKILKEEEEKTVEVSPEIVDK